MNTAAAVAKGRANTILPGGNARVTIKNLSSLTAYTLYAIAHDAVPLQNQMTDAAVRAFTTLDNTAPAFLSAQVVASSITASSADVMVELDEPGSVVYFAALASTGCPDPLDAATFAAGTSADQAGTLAIPSGLESVTWCAALLSRQPCHVSILLAVTT